VNSYTRKHFIFIANNTSSFSFHFAQWLCFTSFESTHTSRLQFSGLGEPFLSLFEVDDGPDGVKVLCARFRSQLIKAQM
jgi:hypothetical protein